MREMKKLMLGLLMALAGGAAFAYEFGASAPFYEFNRDKESELQNCLNEAVTAMQSGTVNVKNAAVLPDRRCCCFTNPRMSNLQILGSVVCYFSKARIAST